MNTRFFITLEAILRHGSFAEAGNEVGLTASAVSLQVQKMEQYFGQPLFDRSSRTARPTEFARQVVATTKATMMSIESLRLKQTLDISGRLTSRP